MFLRFALALFAIAASGAAFARPLEAELPKDAKACWERTYDEAHLAAHPKQKVTRVKLVHLPGDWPQDEAAGFFVDLKLNLRKRVKTDDFDYSISAFCKGSKGGLLCRNEWDAATWRIERASGGLMIRPLGAIIANPDPYDAEEVADGAARVAPEPDDRAWLLTRRVSNASCRVE